MVTFLLLVALEKLSILLSLYLLVGQNLFQISDLTFIQFIFIIYILFYFILCLLYSLFVFYLFIYLLQFQIFQTGFASEVIHRIPNEEREKRRQTGQMEFLWQGILFLTFSIFFIFLYNFIQNFFQAILSIKFILTFYTTNIYRQRDSNSKTRLIRFRTILM